MMVKARIKLNTGEIVSKEFDSKQVLIDFIMFGGHELIKAIYRG